ncbi:MAG: glycosyltransferase family 4 protein [Desulfuromonadales bacterium]|nr:glycosyltransferase family 4 protein [Desulfuromonadales bacterium]
MRLLIVAPQQDKASGNWVSALRLKAGQEQCGHTVELLSVTLAPDSRFIEQVEAFDPDMTLLLHAYRSGKPWLQAFAERPFCVLLTGTDVNQGLDDAQQRPVIEEVFKRAGLVLHQNPLLARQLCNSPDLVCNLRELPAGIVLGETPYQLKEKHKLPQDKPLLLCPAGIRPVKGVLELLHLFDAVAARTQAFHLAFCGPVLDKAYASDFMAQIKSRSWASYLGTIPSQCMAAAMRQADVVLNNSVNEGLPNALLEAAALGVPILARNIPGNAVIVNPGGNGLLYNSKQEFAAHALRLLEDKDYRRALARPEPKSYSPEREANALDRLLHQVLPTDKKPE